MRERRVWISGTEGMRLVIRIRRPASFAELAFVRFVFSRVKGRSPAVGGEFGEEGGGGHDEGHMAMPATPGAGFAMIEAEIALCARNIPRSSSAGRRRLRALQASSLWARSTR